LAAPPSSDLETPLIPPGRTPELRETRDRILDCAEALFAENGFAATSVRDIANAARLKPASLYNHFPGKQQLYEAVLDRGLEPLLGILEALQRVDSSPRSADEMITGIMRHLGQHPALPRLIHHETATGGAFLIRIARDWIRPLIQKGVAGMKREASPGWSQDEYPLVVAAWLQMIFGHFAMAEVMVHVYGEDPLSSAFIEKQTRFFRKLARMMTRSPDAEASTTDPIDPI
jgi:TetR/AcrR family transcriptional regulator